MTFTWRTAAGELLVIDRPVVLPAFGQPDAHGVRDDITVTPGHIADLPEDVRQALGFVEAVETERPGAGYIVTGAEIRDVDGVPTQVWHAEELPLADLRDARIQEVRRLRAQHENGGIVVSGLALPSDERIQNRVANAMQAFAVDDQLTTIDWEVGVGQFATLDQPTVAAIGVALSRHIQSCFSRSRELIEAIQAGDRGTVLALDITTGWPG